MSDDNEWYFDALDNDHDEKVNRTVRCQRCGATNVEWVHNPGAMGGRGHWVLWDLGGSPHNLSCPNLTRPRMPADFDQSIARAVAKVRGSTTAQYPFDGTYQTNGMRVTSRNRYEAITLKPPTPQPPKPAKKKEKPMRTMYDNHEGAQGTLPICMMDNDYLRNTIRIIAGKFHDQRNQGLAMGRGPNTDDPMVKSIVKQKVWTEQELAERTNDFLTNIAPYVLEACVRGGTVMEEASIAMRLATMRDNAVPGNPLQIVHEEMP